MPPPCCLSIRYGELKAFCAVFKSFKNNPLGILNTADHILTLDIAVRCKVKGSCNTLVLALSQSLLDCITCNFAVTNFFHCVGNQIHTVISTCRMDGWRESGLLLKPLCPAGKLFIIFIKEERRGYNQVIRSGQLADQLLGGTRP